MAPEQLSGGEVTARSDIYSLGLVLYEIFTGQRALDGKNLAELIHKREQSGILPPTAIVKSLDPKIELAIMRCLKPQIDERPGVRAGRRRGPARRRSARGRAGGWRNAVAGHGRGGRQTRRPASRRSGSRSSPRSSPACCLRRAWRSHAALSRACRCRGRSIRSRTARARSARRSGIRARPIDTARGLRINYEYLRYIARQQPVGDSLGRLSNSREGAVMLFWHARARSRSCRSVGTGVRRSAIRRWRSPA